MSNFFGGSSNNFELKIVPISNLKAHELPDMIRVEKLECDMMHRGVLIRPIVVDRNTMVILDGHCRCGALRRLGYSKIAVKFVDYNSDFISVESWNGERITKREVINAGLGGNLMMPKTSKHMFARKGKKIHISNMCKEVAFALDELL